jgi:hypothetical protein
MQRGSELQEKEIRYGWGWGVLPPVEKGREFRERLISQELTGTLRSEVTIQDQDGVITASDSLGLIGVALAYALTFSHSLQVRPVDPWWVDWLRDQDERSRSGEGGRLGIVTPLARIVCDREEATVSFRVGRRVPLERQSAGHNDSDLLEVNDVSIELRRGGNPTVVRVRWDGEHDNPKGIPRRVSNMLVRPRRAGGGTEASASTPNPIRGGRVYFPSCLEGTRAAEGAAKAVQDGLVQACILAIKGDVIACDEPSVHQFLVDYFRRTYRNVAKLTPDGVLGEVVRGYGFAQDFRGFRKYCAKTISAMLRDEQRRDVPPQRNSVAETALELGIKKRALYDRISRGRVDVEPGDAGMIIGEAERQRLVARQNTKTLRRTIAEVVAERRDIDLESAQRWLRRQLISGVHLDQIARNLLTESSEAAPTSQQ